MFIFTLRRGWTYVAGGAHTRQVNGILGLLCRHHFPGIVPFGGGQEPAYTWEHYAQARDGGPDREGRSFPNMAARVLAELWVSLLERPNCSIHLIYLLES